MKVNTKTKEYPINWMSTGNLNPALKISVISNDIAELATVFSDAEETNNLVNTFDDGKTIEYSGYTKFESIMIRNNGIVITLNKEDS